MVGLANAQVTIDGYTYHRRCAPKEEARGSQHQEGA